MAVDRLENVSVEQLVTKLHAARTRRSTLEQHLASAKLDAAQRIDRPAHSAWVNLRDLRRRIEDISNAIDGLEQRLIMATHREVLSDIEAFETKLASLKLVADKHTIVLNNLRESFRRLPIGVRRETFFEFSKRCYDAESEVLCAIGVEERGLSEARRHRDKLEEEHCELLAPKVRRLHR